MFFELVQLAIGNLLRARARLVMTAGGVVVGTTAVILLIALTLGLQRGAEQGLGSNASLTELDVYPFWSPDQENEPPQLDVAAAQSFWRIDGVRSVIAAKYFYGEVWAGDYFGYPSILGIDPGVLPYLGIQAEEGELSLENGQVIIGSQAGMYFNDPDYTGEEWNPIDVDLFNTPSTIKLYQYSGETTKERTINLTASARLAPTENFYDSVIIMDIQQVIALSDWANNQTTDPETFRYDQIKVIATSRETVNDVADTIRSMGYGVGGISDYINQLNGFFRGMRLLLGGIGGVALLVAAFGVANTMIMAILERTKEIGLMKAIGATDGQILSVFLIEAGLVGFVGGLSGVGLSLFLQSVINNAIANLQPDSSGINFLPVDLSQVGGNLIIIPGDLTLFAIILATGIGLLAGIFPALRAANLQPVVALKQE
jgi:putative ABC transport system permease protein